MAEIDVLKAQIVRQDLNTSWGFRLQGGVDQGEPLHITRLTPGSPAARIGLKAGDEVTEVGDYPTEGFTCQQALDLVAQFGETLVLTVERRAKGVIPANPVVGSETEPLKNYQTYDMSGGSKPARPAQVYTQISTQPPDVTQNNDHVVTAGPIIITGQPNPVPQKETKLYQTYDLNGPKAQVPSQPQHDFQFQRVQARPFEDQPKPYYSPVQQQQPEPLPQTPPMSPPHQHYSPPPAQQYSPVPYNYNAADYRNTDYSSPDYSSPDYSTDRDDGTMQSRTFKVLQSLMSSEEPAAGVQGLPPPRSVAQEQWKAEQAAKRGQGGAGGQGSPRVKVFMPQQYNSPLGMYSAKNVVATFQAQAENMMDAMDPGRQGNGHMSEVQRAVQERS